MCLRLLGNCICCCCQLGLKLICALVFSMFGVLIVLAIFIYFYCFYNKTAPVTTTVADTPKALTTDTPERIKAFLHKLIDTI